MPEPTLTTQAPGQPPMARPVPPSWATVAPLLARWRLSVTTNPDDTWEVTSPAGPAAHRVWWRELPAAIAAVAARCEAAEKGKGEKR